MSGRLQVEVLGPGCPKCVRTEQIVRDFIQESGLDAEVRKVGNLDRMLELGAMATPAIAIDGELRMAGKIPGPAELCRLFGIES